MMVKMIGVGLVAAALFAAPVAAKEACCATGKKAGCEMGRKGGEPQKGWEALNLTDQQKQQLKDLRNGMKDERMDQMEKQRALREKTREELLKPSSSMSVLDGYAKQVADLHQQMATQETEHLLKVKAILTQEQFNKMLSKEFWMGMCGMSPGMGPQMGPGGRHMGPGCPMKPGEGCPPNCPQMKDGAKGKPGCPMQKDGD